MRQLLYFSTSWCGPCKVFKPVMEQLQSEGLNITFIDAENSPLSQQYGIRSVPTCIVLENDQEITRWTGALDKNEVKRRYSAII